MTSDIDFQQISMSALSLFTKRRWLSAKCCISRANQSCLFLEQNEEYGGLVKSSRTASIFNELIQVLVKTEILIDRVTRSVSLRVGMCNTPRISHIFIGISGKILDRSIGRKDDFFAKKMQKLSHSYSNCLKEDSFPSHKDIKTIRAE